MPEEKKKKRDRNPNNVRVVIEFGEELRLALGNGKRATNEVCAKFAQNAADDATKPALEAYYRGRLQELGVSVTDAAAESGYVT